MKGFGLRERNGLIVFLCLVTLLLALGPIADRCGCTRRYEPPAPSMESTMDTLRSNAVTEVQVADSAARRVRKNARRGNRKESGDSVGKPRRKKSSGNSRRPSVADPRRRNYLDEPI